MSLLTLAAIAAKSESELVAFFKTQATVAESAAVHAAKAFACDTYSDAAGEMIQLVAIPLGMGATKAQFDAAIAVHPTLAEELVTMRRPARHIGMGGSDKTVGAA